MNVKWHWAIILSDLALTYCLGLAVTDGSSPSTEAALSDLIGKRLRVLWRCSHLFTPSTQWILLSVWNPIRQSHTCEPCQSPALEPALFHILYASFKHWNDIFTFHALHLIIALIKDTTATIASLCQMLWSAIRGPHCCQCEEGWEGLLDPACGSSLFKR